MNTILKEKVFEILNEDLNYIQTLYTKNRILCIFTTGLINYGFAEVSSDIEIEAFYLPSFEDLCLNTGAFTKTIQHNGHSIVIKDFRLVKQSAYHFNVEVEALYTDFMIVNPAYENLYQTLFKEPRDLISSCNINLKVADAAKTGMLCLKDGNYFEAYRLYYFCNTFKEKKDYFKSIYIIDPVYSQFLYRLKHQKMNGNSDGITIVQLYNYFKKILDDFQKEKSKTEEPSQLKIAIIEIMRLGIGENADAKTFIKKCTDTELRALKYIQEQIGYEEGTIIISKMVSDSNISRPVFNNLFSKMKDHRIAEIVNMGTKGTKIRFINASIFDLIK